MTTEQEILLSKINSRQAKIGVIGLGYVGLSLAVEFAKAGFFTYGIDIDKRKVDALNAGRSYVIDIAHSDLAEVVSSGKLRGTLDFSILRDCDAVSICVPTPLSKTHDPDLSYVISAVDEVAKYVHAGMLIVLESTTYPGTTDEIIIPKVVSNGYEVGKDVYVAFSPERIDPGRKDYVLKTTPKVVGGATPSCLEIASALYSHIVGKVVPVSSVAAAEMAKLLENTFRAVNIALANEILLMCDKLGLDAWEVIAAAATKPYGFLKFTPGPGVGGHCIPLDPQYLSWKLRTLNYNARFVQLAEEINRSMPARKPGFRYYQVVGTARSPSELQRSVC
jgi:UDP-N-acetyl-D-glucosamine dehydrogenase